MTVETISPQKQVLAAEQEVARSLYSAGEYEDCLFVVRPIGRDESVTSDRRLWALLLESSALSELDRYMESAEALKLAAPLLDDAPPSLKSNFFGQRAHVNIKLGKKDDPLIDYEAARHWAQQTGDDLNVARVRNNIARQYAETGRILEAVNEVDAAIRIASRLNDNIHLGRFYDQKAHILILAGEPAQALACSKKALVLLDGHPALHEARTTHGRALIILGASFLETPQTLEEFSVRRDAAKTVQVSLNPALIKRALTRTNGHVLTAARLLGVRHSALIRAADRHGINRHPKRIRTKK